MAYIRKLKSGNYQVQIRLSGLKPISKTFPTKKRYSFSAKSKKTKSFNNPLVIPFLET